MIQDILSVMWKERKGLFRYRGSLRQDVLTLFTPVVMLGIFLPLQEGRDWVSSPLLLIAAWLVPAILVGMKIPDSFAGERERHTLGTLLASRLPDRAILFGKVVVAVGYGWGVTLVVLLLGLVTVNVLHWEGQVLLYSPTITLAAVGLSLLMAMFVAGVGVLASLRAATVQGATQTLMFAILMVPMVLLMVLPLAVQSRPGGKQLIKNALGTVGSTGFVLAVVAVVFLINVGLLMLAMRRFQRARLILD